jgi:hypothetical protein
MFLLLTVHFKLCTRCCFTCKAHYSVNIGHFFSQNVSKDEQMGCVNIVMYQFQIDCFPTKNLRPQSIRNCLLCVFCFFVQRTPFRAGKYKLVRIVLLKKCMVSIF